MIPPSCKNSEKRMKKNIEQIDPALLDWDAYEVERVHASFKGSEYRYDIAKVRPTALAGLWVVVEKHYTRPIDHAWVSKQLDALATREQNIDEQHAADASIISEEKQADAHAIPEEATGSAALQAQDDPHMDVDTTDGSQDAGDGHSTPSAAMSVAVDHEAIPPMDVVKESESMAQPTDTPTDSSLELDSTPPPNQLMLGTKRRQREDEDEDENGVGMPVRKRSAMPAAQGSQNIIAFDASLALLSEYTD
ncbi:hypothetical protein JVT61DRAFT_14273 [Boletus reticuloceps]|uniref:Uncharacterized protein n=1 Tax=Boletus reticuloceps TaxID=495285 RepID=A0A8I2YCW1_9AGAM|nr:hypothetical protein JVT61DRAFT_14273 [Boletus reticuloceps]